MGGLSVCQARGVVQALASMFCKREKPRPYHPTLILSLTFPDMVRPAVPKNVLLRARCVSGEQRLGRLIILEATLVDSGTPLNPEHSDRRHPTLCG